MKSFHRLLLVWLLLLALPFQGLATAGMLPCAPALPSHAMAHDKADMATPKDHSAADGHCAAEAGPGKVHGGHHDGKSGACGDCCIGAAMAPALLPALVLAPPRFISIPFRAGHVPSVDPALPERPPRTALA